MYVTKACFDKDWHSTPHSHPFSEIFYITHGSGKILIEENMHKIRENDLVIINSNAMHSEFSAGVPIQYIVAAFEGTEFTFHDGESFRILNLTDKHDDFVFYFETMLTEIEKKRPDYETLCQNILEVILIKLARLSDGMIDADSHKISRECMLIKRYIDDNYAQNIGLEELSEIAHINKFYLVHAYKKCTGLSPISYLIERRIDESKHLLSSTDYSVSQISNFVGFSSPSYFSQIFKKSVGITPNKYRKNSASLKSENSV